MRIEYKNVTPGDFESLVTIRIEAMKESLERIGRFDPERARVRLERSFVAEETKYISKDNVIVGFFSTTEGDTEIKINHLYLLPDFQHQGIGKVVLEDIIRRSELKKKDIVLSALRKSDANAFYTNNGFELVSIEEWDNNYVRRHRG